MPAWPFVSVAVLALAGAYRRELWAILRGVRVEWKRLCSRFRLVPSFCKHCGRDVHDFVAPDGVWEQVEPHVHGGHVLCYDCFCDVCSRIGLPTVWMLALNPGAPLPVEGGYVVSHVLRDLRTALIWAEAGFHDRSSRMLRDCLIRMGITVPVHEGERADGE